MSDDIVTRLRESLQMIHPDPQDVRDAIKEIERLCAENQRLKEARFDLQASDFHCWVCADFLPTARRPTDIHRLKEEEKSVPEEYEVFEHKEGGAW